MSIENNAEKTNQFAPLFFFKTANPSLVGKKRQRTELIPNQLF